MPTGYLALVLHAHLPFVRHPEHPRAMEERWLYEALVECYLPLLGAFERLVRAGVPFAITMSLTAPLAAMLRDPLLQRRFEEHLTRLETLARREVVRLDGDERFEPVARFYVEYLAEARTTWNKIRGDVVGALVRHHDAGRIELLASGATHAYLPGLLPVRPALQAQLRAGMAAFTEATGRRAAGMWLPECAYSPAFDEDLARAGVRFTILDTHGLTMASPRPPLGAHAPVASPAGVAFFARDEESSRQVWSRHEGYPGDAYYREFYRDVGFDLPIADLGEEMGPEGIRQMTGLKYFRITGKTENKAPYQPGVAIERADEHAGNFLFNRGEQVRHLADALGVPPLVVAPYDAELFGHWWFEGPAFLERFFFRLAAARAGGDHTLEAVTLSGYLRRRPAMVCATPAASSWGAEGYGIVWVGPESAHLWRHVHHASRYVAWLLDRNRFAEGLRGDALDQAIREMFLLQASDWAFILRTGTVTGYAMARVRAHVHRLRHLAYLVEKPELDAADAAYVSDVSSRDNFLQELRGHALRNCMPG